MRRLLVFVALFFSLPAQAVTIDWVPVGNAGNAVDTPSTNCFAADCGSVAYDYWISKYETTNAQYAELLNAKAASDPLGLYNPSMGSDATFGGITQSGSPGSFAYTVKAEFANKPVTYVSFYNSLRFSNWLNNGQGSADTETGAYTITVDGITGNTITRNGGANIFLPSENEWYKAAYYSPGGVYFEYPTGTNSETGCVPLEEDTGNSANCNNAVNALTNVGAYALSGSPYGTYDQGGNVWEWNEEIVSGSRRGARGGGWYGGGGDLAASGPTNVAPTGGYGDVGFRVASLVPEPGTSLLMTTSFVSLLGMALRGRRRS